MSAHAPTTVPPPAWMSDEEWLEARRQVLTATDSAAILGVSRFKSALEVYAEKVGKAPPIRVTEVMEMGLRLEPLIADLYQERTGRDVAMPADRLTRHPGIPWLGASLDRMVTDPLLGAGVLEIKSTSLEVRDEPLVEWQVQVAHQMEVAQVCWGAIAVLVRGQRFEVFDMEKDSEFTDALLVKLEHFWREHVKKGVPPPPDGSTSAGAAILALHPGDNGGSVLLPSEADAWAAQYRDASEEASEAERRKREARNLLAAAIGDASFGVTPGGVRISYKLRKASSFNVDRRSSRQLRILAG